jgi:hypothetical protein
VSSKKRTKQSSSQQQAQATSERKPVETSSQAPPVQQPAASLRHYLDVSAVRIQPWLARTPELRGRRGASVRLTDCTSQRTWEAGRLPQRTTWNDEAGDLGGVVTLRADEGLTDEEAANVLETAAREVVGRLRKKLPGCALQAVLGSGETYAAAYPGMLERRQTGNLVVDSPPAPCELVLAKPCDRCRSAPAQTRIDIVDTAYDVCEDCRLRYDVTAAGYTKGDWWPSAPQAERDLRDALSKELSVVGFWDDFRALAEAASDRIDNASTQLALICADGNRVGRYLDRFTVLARKTPRLRTGEVVKAIDTATKQALADAVRSCPKMTTKRPLIAPHYAGGDDLLVSVPARLAWPFTLDFLAAVDRHLESRLRDVRGLQRPTVSAGIVFHHLSDPFPDVVAQAKRRLGQRQGNAPRRGGDRLPRPHRGRSPAASRPRSRPGE